MGIHTMAFLVTVVVSKASEQNMFRAKTDVPVHHLIGRTFFSVYLFLFFLCLHQHTYTLAIINTGDLGH
jgi:hypothetical protein